MIILLPPVKQGIIRMSPYPNFIKIVDQIYLLLPGEQDDKIRMILPKKVHRIVTHTFC